MLSFFCAWAQKFRLSAAGALSKHLLFYMRITMSHLGFLRFFSMLCFGFEVLAPVLLAPFFQIALLFSARTFETACIRRIRSSSAEIGSARSRASRLDIKLDGSSGGWAAIVQLFHDAH
mmetsp:Transcript_20212/g.61538  ORF Transcript_20212/g.61538 Transcript_20212/m.61538 type:complete len:119 (-) Transcript_20212:125-481(-)